MKQLISWSNSGYTSIIMIIVIFMAGFFVGYSCQSHPSMQGSAANASHSTSTSRNQASETGNGIKKTLSDSKELLKNMMNGSNKDLKSSVDKIADDMTGTAKEIKGVTEGKGGNSDHPLDGIKSAKEER